MKYLTITFLMGFILNYPIFALQDSKKEAINQPNTKLDGREKFKNQQELDKRAQKLENEIMSPCCFGGTLVTHAESSLTLEMKSRLRTLLAQGLTDEQVINSMVEYYGKKMNLPPNEWQRIRATPTKTGFNILVWLMPVIGSIAGIILVSWLIHHFISMKLPKKKEEILSDSEDINPEMAKRIEKELNNIEV